MRRRKLKFKWVKGGVAGLALLILAGLVFPTWTPRIQGENSISELKKVKINGDQQEVMIRGKNRRNPVLLFVHGGPACSEIPYVRKYQDLLEQNFTIVHYDQRGSGKSYHFFEDYSSVTTDELVDDLLTLTDYVKIELNQPKVLLVGHSFGTYIAMKAAAKAPERFYAYIGIGQVADTIESELDNLDFVIEEAKKAGHEKEAEKLERLRDPIRTEGVIAPRDKVRKYGGASRLIKDQMDYVKGFLFSPEYNLMDTLRFARGVAATSDRLLEEEAHHNLPGLVKQLDIPVYFVMGKYDHMTSAKVARAYYDTLTAPEKEFILFDQSAHYPQFEEKETFAEWLNETWEELRDRT
ncbi:alpha/beta fold hydrolase [Gorillibacterium timonense]|uniref:alpha/beta fold hydrolase n=1 Tax=Gorillibacterium timonense TaxID=1689269 RepID=UPI00071DB458|nr:alpha/beta hydrolase [Gorillibacterium timonense]